MQILDFPRKLRTTVLSTQFLDLRVPQVIPRFFRKSIYTVTPGFPEKRTQGSPGALEIQKGKLDELLLGRENRVLRESTHLHAYRTCEYHMVIYHIVSYHIISSADPPPHFRSSATKPKKEYDIYIYI